MPKTHMGNELIVRNAVLEHVNRRRGGDSRFSQDDVQVVWSEDLGEGSCLGIVRVNGLDGSLFQVSYDRAKNELKVDTYTRKHVSRFY